MTDITIKLLRPGDERLFVRAVSLFNDEDLTEDAARALLADETFVMVVALDAKGELMGRSYGHVLRRPTQSDLFLYEVDVDDAHQRKGAGRAMLQYLKTLCAERGLREMFVMTEVDNAAANALYKSVGGILENSPANTYVYFSTRR
jgi:aminoglycoside 3-N-acetyltransferase I